MAERVAIGESGNLLTFELATLNKLALVDLKRQKIHGYVDLPDNALFDCSAEKLVVIQPQKQIVRRYNLKTLRPEFTATVDVPQIPAMAIGSASHGPMMVLTSAKPYTGLAVIDLDTLRPIEVESEQDDLPVLRELGDARVVRASANGRLFTASENSGRANDAFTLKVDGSRVGVRSRDKNDGYAVPDHSGQTVFSRDSIANADLQPLPISKTSEGYTHAIPAATGDLFVNLESASTSTPKSVMLRKLSLNALGNPGKLLELDPVNLTGDDEGRYPVSIVRVSDGSGKEVFHTITVDVVSNASIGSDNADAGGQTDSKQRAPRVWSDASGKFSITATFVKQEGSDIYLRREDGAEFKIELQRLSDEDKRYISAMNDRNEIARPGILSDAVNAPSLGGR